MSNNEQIKTIQQTFMEVAHAQHNGSAWYTKGDSGLYQQVSMWLGRGQAALADLEKQLAERDAALARCVEALRELRGVAHTPGGITLAAVIDDTLAFLPASAQATAKVQQWRPIETAPKDGTEIILSREARVTSGLWFDMGGDDEGAEGWSGWVSQDGGFSEEHPPTNWMPLPEPPTEAIREEKETK